MSETNALKDTQQPRAQICELCKKNFTQLNGEHICRKCRSQYSLKQSKIMTYLAEIAAVLIIILPMWSDALSAGLGMTALPSWLLFPIRTTISAFAGAVVLIIKRMYGTKETEKDLKIADLQTSNQTLAIQKDFAVSQKDDALDRLQLTRLQLDAKKPL